MNQRSVNNCGIENKVKNSMQPSKVLHVRGLPENTTETELKSVFEGFAPVVKCFLLSEKYQAFVQMESVEIASEVLLKLKYSAVKLRGKQVYFEFSSRQEIEIKKQHSGNSGQASSILLLTVWKVTCPIYLEDIYRICKPYGKVLKVITFRKGIDFQALVQMSTVDAAINTKIFLEGKKMYPGGGILRIGFSKRSNLVVKRNNRKSRDFTVKPYPELLHQQKVSSYTIPTDQTNSITEDLLRRFGSFNTPSTNQNSYQTTTSQQTQPSTQQHYRTMPQDIRSTLN